MRRRWRPKSTSRRHRATSRISSRVEATLALKAALLQRADNGAGMGGEAARELDELNSQLAAATAEKEALVAQIGALKEAPAAAFAAYGEAREAGGGAASREGRRSRRRSSATRRRRAPRQGLRDEVDEIKAHKAALARRARGVGCPPHAEDGA